MTLEQHYLAALVEAIGSLVVNEMRQQRRGTAFPPTIEPKIALWFLTAAENVLADPSQDLAQALGLKATRGRQRTEKPSGPVYERAKDAFWMQLQGKSWSDIADKYPETDLRQIQREVDRYRPNIIGEAALEILTDLVTEAEPANMNGAAIKSA